MASTQKRAAKAKQAASQPRAMSPARNAKSISVAQVKAHLSSVLSGVEQSRKPVTILRRGVAVAQIIPVIENTHAPLYGSMRGTATELGDIVGPTGEDWGMGGD